MTEIKPPIVTEDDVLAGSKEIEVLTRSGKIKKIIVSAMNWRTALGSTFTDMDKAMIRIVENCVAKEAQKILDELPPVHLVWITTVAQQLTNGVDALKKAAAARTAAAAPVSESSLPSKAS